MSSTVLEVLVVDEFLIFLPRLVNLASSEKGSLRLAFTFKIFNKGKTSESQNI